MAVYATLYLGVQPVGALFAGMIAKRIGAAMTMTVLGSIVLAACLFYIFRVLIRVEKPQVQAEI
jgi:hypothetical protein